MTDLTLFVVRHAEPAYPRDALTPRGQRQARSLARRFARARLTDLFSSPLGRAVQTAGTIARATGLPCAVEPWTAELESWAIAEGTPEEAPAWQVHPPAVRGARPPVDGDNWHRLAVWGDLPLAERFAALGRESDAFLARFGWVRDGERYCCEPDASSRRVAVVCHAGFALTWLAHLLAVPPPLVWAGFALAPAAVTEVELRSGDDGTATPRCLAFGVPIGNGGAAGHRTS
ncbi:MAG TPA: histidine phosphatase family protein [Thermoanaerobaculia bacterium]